MTATDPLLSLHLLLETGAALDVELLSAIAGSIREPSWPANRAARLLAARPELDTTLAGTLSALTCLGDGRQLVLAELLANDALSEADAVRCAHLLDLDALSLPLAGSCPRRAALDVLAGRALALPAPAGARHTTVDGVYKTRPQHRRSQLLASLLGNPNLAPATRAAVLSACTAQLELEAGARDDSPSLVLPAILGYLQRHPHLAETLSLSLSSPAVLLARLRAGVGTRAEAARWAHELALPLLGEPATGTDQLPGPLAATLEKSWELLEPDVLAAVLAGIRGRYTLPAFSGLQALVRPPAAAAAGQVDALFEAGPVPDVLAWVAPADDCRRELPSRSALSAFLSRTDVDSAAAQAVFAAVGGLHGRAWAAWLRPHDVPFCVEVLGFDRDNIVRFHAETGSHDVVLAVLNRYDVRDMSGGNLHREWLRQCPALLAELGEHALALPWVRLSSLLGLDESLDARVAALLTPVLASRAGRILYLQLHHEPGLSLPQLSGAIHVALAGPARS